MDLASLSWVWQLINYWKWEREISNSAGHQVYSLPTCSNNGWQVNNQYSSVLFKRWNSKAAGKTKKMLQLLTLLFFFSLIVFKLHSFSENFNQGRPQLSYLWTSHLFARGLLLTESYTPPKFICWSLIPSTQNLTVSGLKS